MHAINQTQDCFYPDVRYPRNIMSYSGVPMSRGIRRGAEVISQYPCQKLSPSHEQICQYICLWSPQIYKGDPRNCAILSWYGAQIGGLQVFPVSKIIMIRLVRMPIYQYQRSAIYWNWVILLQKFAEMAAENSRNAFLCVFIKNLNWPIGFVVTIL